MATYFNEYFGVPRDALDDYGAFNVSIINDLPLFIDPFLLFQSTKPEYKALHSEILAYIIFLRDQVIAGRINKDLIAAWFCFSEVRQNWLGFSLVGNGGSAAARMSVRRWRAWDVPVVREVRLTVPVLIAMR